MDAVSELPHQQAQHVVRVVQELAPEQLERLPLLNDILNLGLPESELTASLEPALRQESLVVFLLTLLRIWAEERPLILILEDAHWIDSLSWQMALQVARGLSSAKAPFLLVVVSRPLTDYSQAEQYAAPLRALPLSNVFNLKTLSHEETIALVTARLGLPQDALPEPVAHLVRTRADGNPFFAEELVFTLRDQGLIRLEQRDGQVHCLLSEQFVQASQTLPDTLQGLILARIDRLSPEKQLTLKVAAVIGRTFSMTPLHYTLNHYTKIVQQALVEQLNDLTLHDLTLLDLPQPDLSYIFKHIMTQETAYNTLLFAQRKELHRTVAQWYEQT